MSRTLARDNKRREAFGVREARLRFCVPGRTSAGTSGRDPFAHGSKPREAFGVREACFRFCVAVRATARSGRHQRRNLRAPIPSPATTYLAKRLECVKLASAFASAFRLTTAALQFCD